MTPAFIKAKFGKRVRQAGHAEDKSHRHWFERCARGGGLALGLEEIKLTGAEVRTPRNPAEPGAA